MTFDVSNQTFVANLNSLIHSNQSCTYMIVGEVISRGMEDSTQKVEADEKEEIFSYKMAGLRPCTNYTAYIKADKDSFKVPFSTYNDVQDVLVSTEGNGSVSVQCVFVSGSTADGCHVIFTDTSNGRNEHFNVTGSGNTIVTLSTSRVYDVTAHDISDDGSIAPWTCVQPKQVDVKLNIAIPSIVHSSSYSTVHSTAISSSTSNITSSPTVIIGNDDTSGNGDSSMVYIITSVVLMIIPFTLCVVVVMKRNHKNKVTLNAERAACHQSQAEMSHYEIHDPIGPVAIDMSNDERSSGPTSGPVQGTIVDPYHVSTDELLAIRNRRPVQDNNSHVTTPQEGQTQDQSPSSSTGSVGSLHSTTPLMRRNTFNTDPTDTPSRSYLSIPIYVFRLCIGNHALIFS
ncbi:PREDICTED: uncharacterized protein LOC109585253 [Amphimedon queenslandica]|uniref:Uncharacterized protein n=1 Tax=Amphimedon queenslandica TaxID=400682 RepID=A0AAN0JIL8_AMPQE|nr:PREDICTED: uncharacterized protein LOC109585253 [Amphimedon queenslandica]|eukprot:XP_019856809.1 PREDICTED: uncharacterized protein LOC109585253 [Amphimedon queenslandica]